MLSLWALLVAIAGCGTSSSPGPAEGATVSFSTSYEDALHAITDLGLQPAASVCGSGIGDYGSNGTVYRGPWWQPVGAEIAFDAENGTVVVWPTPLAALNWPDRLRSAPGATIDTIYLQGTPFNCPGREVEGTPPPGASKFVAPDQLDVYGRLAFASQSQRYEAALSAVTNLGLRLADPCYEQAKARGTAPTWHSMGQEGSFANTTALVVAPTAAASANWQAQARALPGALALDAPYTPPC